MATISQVNADFIAKNPPAEQKDTEIRVYFGVFFDGTSNNMIQGETARKFRKDHKKNKIDGREPNRWEQHIGQGRHSYEVNDLTKTEAEILDNEKERGYEEKGLTLPRVKNTWHDWDEPRRTQFGYSNVAILHSKYQGKDKRKEQKSGHSDVKEYIYKIYVEGSGANDIKEFKTGAGINGLGFGLGKTGVVALVSKAVKAVDMKLKAFGANNHVEVHFDIFGFSRGSACARLFAYLIARERWDRLNEREREFGKYYCKGLYNNATQRLDYFLEDYVYLEKPELCGKSITIDFLGIYDTVVSIGLLRRKKKDTKSNSYLNFAGNRINPLKIGMSLDNDFWGNYHDLNVKEYGMFSPKLRNINTFHICAMDEYRENFALTDIGKSVPANGLEIYLPGCHSDIGGGYICGAEDRTVLNKFPFQSLLKKENFAKNYRTIENRDGLNPVQIYTSHPEDGNGSEQGYIGWKTMQKLGWIPDFLNMSGTDFITKERPFIWDKKSRIEIKLAGDRHLLGNLVVHKYEYNKSKGKWINLKNPNESLDDEILNNKDIVAIKGFLCYKGKFEEEKGVQGKSGNENSKVICKNKEGEEVICEFIENSARFGMTRKVPLIFGNVPLHLMVNRAHSVVSGRKMFHEDLENNEYFYKVPKGLNDFYHEIDEYIKNKKNKGTRKWFYPDNEFDSQKYREIRENYLHFTSEQKIGLSRLWDVPNEHIQKGDGYTWADEKIMTRIIYHGDEDEDEAGNMHYMHHQKNIQ